MRTLLHPRRAGRMLLTAAVLSSCDADSNGEPSPPGATAEVPARAGFDLLVGFVDDSGTRIVYVDARGGTVRDLGGGEEPAWAPDGRTFAFVHRSADVPEVFLGDVRTGTRTRVGPGNSPTFSPDGQRLAFLRRDAEGSSLFAVPVASPGTAPLLLHRDTERDEVGTPRGVVGADWSPDGASLVYTWYSAYDCGFWDGPTACPSPTGGMVIVDVTSGGARDADHGVYVSRPRYSPDGRHIVANLAGDGARIVRTDGSEPPSYVNGLPWVFDWSPNGASLLAAEYRDDGTHLSSRSIATGASEPLQSIRGNVLAVAWAR